MTSNTVLLGAGGHARSVADVLTRAGGQLALVAGEPDGAWSVPVASSDAEAFTFAEEQGCQVLVAVGPNDLRHRLHLAVATHLRSEAVVAPSATVASDLGAGTVVLNHAHVGPASVIGEAVVINTASVVEHDCRIDDAVHIAPGARVLGGVTIGALTLVGSGATVLPGVKVGARVTIGAGAVVISDVPDGATVLGVPGRVIGAGND
jgi:sugar O-acyltransferase (sialic acid O-acetyltransferase NeuD family)